MRYYFIAGERSGDLHGSNLMKALKRLDEAANFRGFGGGIQEQATVREISEEVKRLVVDNAYRSRIQEEYKKIYHILDTGSASENAARLMVGYLKNDV